MINAVQVPPSIPRPDYADTGVPVSEIEFKQQNIGGLTLNILNLPGNGDIELCVLVCLIATLAAVTLEVFCDYYVLVQCPSGRQSR